MKKSKLMPALLLTFASLLFLYLRASFISPPNQIIRLLLALWFVLLLLALPAYWLTRDGNWAGLLLVIVVLGFFSRDIFAYSYTITVVSILFIIWSAYHFLKRKFLFNHVFLVINLVSIIAIILSLVVLQPSFKIIPPAYYSKYMDLISSKNYIVLNPRTKDSPDIYYIVLDGYGRTDILYKLYDYDNSEFIRSLEKRGFTIPKNSRANYPKTALSVTSTLNMQYIENFAPGLEASNMWWLMSPWIDHGLVRNSLERIGYTSVSISTIWSITDNPTTDYYLKSHPIMLSDFDRYFLGVTPTKIFKPVLNSIFAVPTYESHRRSQLNNFDALVRSSSILEQKFIFAHIILPHPPFVFSSSGRAVDPAYSYSLNDANDYQGTSADYRDHYVGQLQFLNRKLEEVIETILQNSRQPPIIILQADHGPGMLTDFASAANTCLAERLSTFSAYYLPDIDPEEIPDDITPVNLYRIVLNEYFAADLPLLENKQFYPRQALDIYNLEDVTAIVDSMENCSIR